MRNMPLLIKAIQLAIDLEEDDRDPSKITMSSLGHCARKLAYRHHGVSGATLDFKAKGTLDDGNMAHAQLRPWIRRGLIEGGSCYRLVDQEKDVETHGIGGHIDGFLKHRNSKCHDKGHDDMLLEVKSMNEYRFKDFKEHGKLDFEYRCQVSGYLSSLGLYHAIILGKNKNKFDLHEQEYEIEPALLNDRFAIVDRVKVSNNPEEINKEHQPMKGGILPWQCGYCPFVKLCWRHEGVIEIKPKLYKVTNL